MQRPAEQRTVRKCEHLATDKRCLLTRTSDGGQASEPHHDRNRLAARAYDGGNPRAVDPPHPLPRPAPEPSSDVVVVVESSEPTSIANSPRPRPSTRQRRSGILRAALAFPARPHLPFGSARNVPSRRRPGPGPRVPHAHLPGQRRRRISAAAADPPAETSAAEGISPTVGTSHRTKPYIDSTAGPVRRAPGELSYDDATTAIDGRLRPPDPRKV